MLLLLQKSRDYGTSSYSTNYDPMNTVSSSFASEDGLPDAASEKDLVGIHSILL